MMRILVIDDQQDLLMLLCDALEQEGYSVKSATSIQVAQEYLTNESFDLILCDVVLPESNLPRSPLSSVVGMVGIKKMSASFPNIPVVAMSGDLSGESLEYMEQLGARNTLEKPFRLNQLLETIEETLIAWR